MEFARRHNLWLLSDEVYDRLCYREGAIAPSLLRIAEPDDAVLIAQSFSKAWCMTGWRLRWLVSRPDLCSRAAHFKIHRFACAERIPTRRGSGPTARQPFIEELVSRLRSNREYCFNALTSISGVSVPAPEGGFYLFPKIEGLRDSFALCKDVLLTTKVGLAPGVAFGAGGEGSVRLCYAAERSVLEPAIDRFRRYLSSRGAGV